MRPEAYDVSRASQFHCVLYNIINSMSGKKKCTASTSRGKRKAVQLVSGEALDWSVVRRDDGLGIHGELARMSKIVIQQDQERHRQEDDEGIVAYPVQFGTIGRMRRGNEYISNPAAGADELDAQMDLVDTDIDAGFERELAE